MYVYTMCIPMKNKMLTLRMTNKEKANLKKLAAKEGHNSVASFIMWLIRQYGMGKLEKK